MAEAFNFETKHVCEGCISEPYLRKVIEILDNGQCDYCMDANIKVIPLPDLAIRVESAFDKHYQRTSPEPDDFEYAMIKDKEIEYDWYRKGDPVLELLTSLLSCSEEIARDVLDLLADKHDINDWGDTSECEFGRDSYYEMKEISIGSWNDKWNILERDLKHENRYFNKQLFDLFESVFDGVDKAKSYNDELAIISVGPKTDFSTLYRAREFNTPEDVGKALEKPVESLGPPPSDKARANRMNPSGVSIFYGAQDEKSALAEIRPAVGSYVVVSKFEVTRPIRLLDLRALDKLIPHGSVFDPDFFIEREKIGFLRTLGNRLISPVMPGDQAHGYLITQAVADYLARLECPSLDGIIYKSVQDGIGANVALFRKSSLVEPLKLEKDTEIVPELYDFDFETGTAYPYFRLYLKRKLVSNKNSQLNRLVDTNSANDRSPALKLVLDSVTVHSVTSVEIKSIKERVSIIHNSEVEESGYDIDAAEDF